MSEIKHQIFISSTYIDLIDERQKVVESVIESSNIPAGMELFTGENVEQWNIIKHWIDESDVFVLLLGGRYGTLASDENISYIEKEYNYAQIQGIPTYIFVLSDAYLYKKQGEYSGLDIFEKNNKDKYKLFKDKILKQYAKMDINNLDNLKNVVYKTLIDNKKNWSGGWVKNIIKKNYENNSYISIFSILDLNEFCEYYGEQDPLKKYLDKSVQHNVDNMLQSLSEYIRIVEDHKIFLKDEVHFKFRSYGNKYGHRGEWIDISGEDMLKIENDFDDLSKKIFNMYNEITKELEPYL
ncbi:DUF4062 domain-containing protein [Staphylococcus saprophyticus]|uniref:DUF4062 domain-containing protein n=1 Tax=Staphylococcus saprophyticus TaxID=29385 RepID=UPI0038233BCC